GKSEGGAHLTRRTASPLQARYGMSAIIGSGVVRACATVVKAIVAPINATSARSPSLRRLPTSIRDPSLGVIDGCAMRLSGVVRHRWQESYKDVRPRQAGFRGEPSGKSRSMRRSGAESRETRTENVCVQDLCRNRLRYARYERPDSCS